MGISEATFYVWKKRYGGVGPSELRRFEHFGGAPREILYDRMKTAVLGEPEQDKAITDYQYPFGFNCCHRQASRIISGRQRLAFQPSSRSALLGSE